MAAVMKSTGAKNGRLGILNSSRAVVAFGTLLGMLVLVGFSAKANIGFVDVNKVIQTSSEGKKAKESIDADYTKKKAQLDKKKAEIDKLAQDLQARRKFMQEDTYKAKNFEIQEMMGNFQKTVMESEAELREKQNSVVQPMLERLTKVTDRIAGEKKLDLVLDTKTPGVIFAKKELDITDEVIKAFEKEKNSDKDKK